MTLLNPYGLLALLAIPLVILIHFLQRRSQKLHISTLFLLERNQKESASGQTFDRLMNSIPLWLQLLFILLLTWLLVQPRYIITNSTQRIAIVIDSSASMSVFKKELKSKLKAIIPELKDQAHQAEYWLLESDSKALRLYHGEDLPELLTKIDVWTPLSGAHDPHHSLRIARSLVGVEGALVYLTDTPVQSAPYDAHLYAIGSAKENAGFTGITYSNIDDQLVWKTFIKNYSNYEVVRSWYLEDDQGRRTPEKQILIPPNQLISLQGAFPKNSNTGKIVLSPDSFTPDDRLPLIKPIPKSLHIASANVKPLMDLTAKLQQSFPNTKVVVDRNSADIFIGSAAEIITDQEAQSHTILFDHTETRPTKHLSGRIVAEQHPLMEHLNWQSLIIKSTPGIELQETDQVLLWQGSRPLIFLRQINGEKQILVFNFALQHSNFTKTEAAIILLLRFADTIREKKLSYQQIMTEVSQPIDLNLSESSTEEFIELTITSLDAVAMQQQSRYQVPSSSELYAPSIPSFFSIKNSNGRILSAANYFADTREADFSQCGESYIPASKNAKATDRHTHEDHLWRIWVGLALLALALSWHFAKNIKTF